MFCAGRGWIDAGNDRCSGRCANGSSGTGSGITHSFGGELVEVGSDRIFVSVTSQLRTVVLGSDPEDVGKFLSSGYLDDRDQQGKGYDEEATICFHVRLLFRDVSSKQGT